MGKRIHKYEFRSNAKGTQLILWAPLERGGRVAIASVKGNVGARPSALLVHPRAVASIPDRLRPKAIPSNL
jgi:hypothetical protein